MQVSYVAHIQHTGDDWPALEQMRRSSTRARSSSGAGQLSRTRSAEILDALLALLGPTL